MAEIVLTRIDFRLIHGQVITKWLKRVGASRIVVIDNALSKDDFMKQIYTMSAPSGVSVDIYSEEEAITYWEKTKFGGGKILLLFKDVESTYNTIKKGLNINEIQIGGLGSGPGKKKIYGPISMDENDFNKLHELHEDGININLHQVPEEQAMAFDRVIKKIKEENLWS